MSTAGRHNLQLQLPQQASLGPQCTGCLPQVAIRKYKPCRTQRDTQSLHAVRTISLKFSKHPEGDFGRTWKSEAVGIVPQHTQHMHALRPPSEREDDAGDEHITVIDYARPLIDNFLSPGTDAKYITTIDPSDVHSSPNTLQAILGEHGNQKLRDGRRDAHPVPEPTITRYTWRPYFGASRVRCHT